VEEDLVVVELVVAGKIFKGDNMKFFKKKKKIHKETGEEYLYCPRCKKHMKKIVKKEVVLDICKKCGGMWVDADEIEKLAEEVQIK
jgi:ribosomal protein L37AE/L43A